ncbi:MAG: hypothetical protein AAF401_05930 [Pseudomonadota bacterium]
MSYSDETLRRYLDGALPEAEAKAIEADMLADRALERRIMALDPMAEAVRETMQMLPDPARLAALEPAEPARPFGRWAGIAAACILGVGIGAFGMGLFGAQANDWRMEVAHYQALDQVRAVMAAVGVDAPVEKLLEVEGLTLRRAQILGHEGAPLGQIVFADAKGQPVALCLVASKSEEALAFGERLGLASAAWSGQGAGWLVIGPVPEAEMQGHGYRLQAALHG